jgi:putative glutathione S-transferase
VRALKGLEGASAFRSVHWLMREHGWTFAEGPGTVPDTVNGAAFLHQVYTAADPRYTGRVTVPVLWDKRSGTIVSNESSEIIRMLNGAFDGVGAAPGDYYPTAPAGDRRVNARVYDTVNNGVYKAGFATSQAAYEEAVGPLFETLEWLDTRLADRRFLLGDALDGGRHPLVHDAGALRPGVRRPLQVQPPPARGPAQPVGLHARLYALPGVAGTVNFEHIKRHYHESHRNLNPTGIVPAGPALDFAAPHGRERLGRR